VCPFWASCLYNEQNHVSNGAGFIADASAGALPAFSLVTPAAVPQYSCHNGFSMTACDNWAGQLVGAVMNGPDWASTAIFITFDDCGCFYDSIAPGVNPDGTPQGPRVPLIIVSPYARPGYTDSTPSTSAGILAYTEETFGLAPLSASDAGAAAAGADFQSAFDYSQSPQHRKVPMTWHPVPRGEHIRWGQAEQDS
jgi:phospholipase C